MSRQAEVASCRWRQWWSWWMLSVAILLAPAFTMAKPLQENDLALGIYVESISEIDAALSTIEVSLIINAQWLDYELAKQLQAEGLQEKAFKQNESAAFTVKTPALAFVDQRKAPYKGTNRIIAYADGRVVYSMYMVLTLDVTMDVRQFPFDKQVFNIALQQLSDIQDTLNIVIDEERTGVSDNATLDEWRILGYEAYVQEVSSHSEQTLSEYVLSIEMERQSGFYMWRFFVPFLFLVVLANCVFWLPNESPIGLIRTNLVILLTIVAYQWSFSESTPHVSYMTFMLSILLFCYVYVASIIPLLIAKDRLSKPRGDRFMAWCAGIYPLILIVAVLVIVWYYFFI